MRRRDFLLAILVLISLATAGPRAKIRAAARPSSPKAGAQSEPPASISLTPDAQGEISHDQVVALVRRAAENDLANYKKARDYTFTERMEKHKLDRKGNIISTESKTFQVTFLYDDPVRRLVAKNDQPLPQNEARKEKRRIENLVKKRQHESPENRQKRIEKEEKDREEQREFVLEIADAYNFRLLGTEKVNGRKAWVLDGIPRPGYHPRKKQAQILSKFHLRVWIDQTEKQWVKLEADAISTVSWGVFIARLNKGSHLQIEQTRVNNEVWLPKRVAVKVDARVALFKSYDFDLDYRFRDYKKFRVSTNQTY